MKHNLLDALQSLKPGAEWSIRGITPYKYSDLEWLDSSQTKPTEDEVTAKIAELEAAEPARLVRIKRDQLLLESDWTQTRDNVRLNDSTWVTYRQELRDITKSASFNPKLNDDGTLDESSVTWPLKPAI